MTTPLDDATAADLAKDARRFRAAGDLQLIDLLRGEERSRPAAPCGLCGNATWRWHPDWLRPGGGRWLCAACMVQPARSLADVVATLAPGEHHRLRIEAANGDPLALAAVRALAQIGRAPGGRAEMRPPTTPRTTAAPQEDDR
jgi:hypothetical protein